MTCKIKVWKEKGILEGDFNILRTYAIEMPAFCKFLKDRSDAIILDLSMKNIGYLSDKDIEWNPEAEVYLNQYKKQAAHELSLVEKSKDIDLTEELNYSFKTKPFDHQLKAFIMSKDQEYYGLFMEMGTGKTKVIIDTAAYLYLQGKIDCAIILAPNGVHAQWIDEQLPTHMPDSLPHLKAIYRASVPSAVREMERIAEEAYSGLKMLSFNIDALSHKKGTELIKKILTKHRCLLVIDESTRIKTPGSKRTKNALAVSELAAFRRIMSGAPITNGYEGLYAQFKFLSPKILGFNSYYTFRNYFCIMGGFEGREVVSYKPNARLELESKVSAFTYRITKEECLTLPEKIYLKRYVDMTPEQADIYQRLEDDLLTELEGKTINTPIALTRILRMQQVLCGHIVDEDKNIIEIPSNRVSILMECIEEALSQPGTKIIIWSRFVYDIKIIHEALKKAQLRHVLYYGEVDTKDREARIQEFKTDPRCVIFLGQQDSGGTGLNLQEANCMIYYSNNFNADTRWQSEDRAHRIGQKKHVTYIDLVVKKTIDVEILGALRSKKNLADALLDDPRNFLRKNA